MTYLPSGSISNFRSAKLNNMRQQKMGSCLTPYSFIRSGQQQLLRNQHFTTLLEEMQMLSTLYALRSKQSREILYGELHATTLCLARKKPSNLWRVWTLSCTIWSTNLKQIRSVLKERNYASEVSLPATTTVNNML